MASRMIRFEVIHHQKSNAPSSCKTNIGLNINTARAVMIIVFFIRGDKSHHLLDHNVQE